MMRTSWAAHAAQRPCWSLRLLGELGAARQLPSRRAMHAGSKIFLLVPLALCIGGCGGSVSGSDASDADSSTDAGIDGAVESGACPVGSSPVECNGVLLYCCPEASHCAPPSCELPDAGDAADATDAAPCPAGQYLLMPCCGGFNNTSCSNGPGPPPPFCTVLPPSCTGQSTCLVGGCEGVVDESSGKLQCTCI
jgi:hypothetical protein